MAIRQYHLALIGCGNMGGALLRGWLDAGIVASAAVLEPNGPPPGLASSAISFFADADAFAASETKPEIVILAVKPQILASVCAAIAPAVPQDALVLSIAAGKTLGTLQSFFPDGQPVIRAMPNTPAAIGKGITGLVAGAGADAEHCAAAETLLAAAGAVEWLADENLIDPLTAISASGPAYLFYFVEALAEAGAKLGLPVDTAMRLSRQMVIGSAALLANDEAPAAQLRRNVTSPNGTTQAALDILMDGRLQSLLDAAAAAAARRAGELSNG